MLALQLPCYLADDFQLIWAASIQPSFDGDGVIHGVYFRVDQTGRIVPCYVNKFVQTDVLLASKK